MAIASAFYTALSGLSVNSASLSVIGNNLANLNTIGFKGTSTTFADLFSTTLGASAFQGNGNPMQVGLGAQVAAVMQNFGQSTFQSTSNVTDMAIQGAGFFYVKLVNGGFGHSRAGNFTIDQFGYVLDPSGNKLQGYNRTTDGRIDVTMGTEDIRLPIGETITARATDKIQFTTNLNSSDQPPNDRYTTSIQVYDSLGERHTILITYEKLVDIIPGSNGIAGDPIGPPIVPDTPVVNDKTAIVQSAWRYWVWSPDAVSPEICNLTIPAGAATNPPPFNHGAMTIQVPPGYDTSSGYPPGLEYLGIMPGDPWQPFAVAGDTPTFTKTGNYVKPGPPDKQTVTGIPTPNVDHDADGDGDPTTIAPGDEFGHKTLARPVNGFNYWAIAEGVVYFDPTEGGKMAGMNDTSVPYDISDTVKYPPPTGPADPPLPLAYADFFPNGEYDTAFLDKEFTNYDLDRNGLVMTPGFPPTFSGGGDRNPMIAVAWKNGAAANAFSWSVNTGGNHLGGGDPYFLITQTASASGTTNSQQTGYGAGTVQGLTVDQMGYIIGTFTNGQTYPLARVALSIFANNHGLQKIGENIWKETLASGPANVGTANDVGRGSVLGAHLEMSNVDVADEFTRLIITQRGYQANSRIVTTSDEMMQETLNLKR